MIDGWWVPALWLIAKLDRLSRNVHFISGLMERKVDFVACESANAFMINVYAAVAQEDTKNAGCMIHSKTKCWRTEESLQVTGEI
jgi:hypothetical protein